MPNRIPAGKASYSLIPQLNSEESDLSDEEFREFYKNGFQIIIKKHVYSYSIDSKNSDRKSCEDSGKMNLEKFALEAKDIFSTKKETLSYERRTMSEERKFSFGLSIFLCIFVTTVFLMLPCDWTNCSCEFTHKGPGIWQSIFPNIEIRGPVHLVQNRGARKFYNLLFMAYGSLFADSPVIRSDLISASGGDLILLDSTFGKQIWRRHFNNMPIEVNCLSFYMKNERIKECILLGHGNYIALLSSTTGKLFWNTYANTKKSRRIQYDFPVLLPDLNQDDIPEILTVKDSNKLIIINGSNGSILRSDISDISCVEISDLKYIDVLTLRYTCKFKNNTDVEMFIYMRNLVHISNLMNKSQGQYVPFRSNNKHDIEGYRIEIQNNGTFCPCKCASNVRILNKLNTTVWSHESAYSYVMEPVIFQVNKTGLFGFVFKIWEHEQEDTKTNELKRYSHNFQMTVGFIYERTVIVVFNSSFSEPLQIINMSLNPILQLYDSHARLQPDPKYQEYSLLITDLWRNGSYEIVTYYSTWEENKKNHRDNYTDGYTLKSYIRMYDLNEELRKGLTQ